MFFCRKSATIILRALFFFSFLVCLHLAIASNAHTQPVTLQLRWDHQFQFAGYYAAQWMGYYDEAGLEVEIRSGIAEDGSIRSAVQEVAKGRAQFGIGASDILIARDKGIDLVVLASIFQQSAAAFFYLDGTSIPSLAALKNMRVARNVNDLIDVELQAMLRSQGLSPKDVAPYPHEPGPWLLLDGSVDVAPGYELTFPFDLRAQGAEFQTIRPKDYDIDFYGDSIFATGGFVRANGDLVRRFVSASLKGWRYALDHPLEIADRISSEMVRSLPVEEVRRFNRFQAEQIGRFILHPMVDIGHINPQRWLEMQNYLKEAGLVSDELRVEDFVYGKERMEQEAFERRLRLIMVVLGIFLFVLALVFAWAVSLRRAVARRTESLREKESHLSVISGSVPGILFQYRIDKDGRASFPLMGGAVMETIGITPEKAMSDVDAVMAIVHPDDREALERAVADSYNMGTPYSLSHRLVRPDGQVRWVKARSVPSRQADGSMVWNGILLDITDVRDTQDRLEQQTRWLTLAQRCALAGVWEWDLKNNTHTWSDELYELFSLDPETVPASYSAWLSVIAPEMRDEVDAKVRSTIREVKEVSIEWRVNEESGPERWFLLRGQPVPNAEGEVDRYLGAVMDVTRIKQAESEAVSLSAHYQKLVETIRYGILEIDLEGRLIFCNSAYEEILGYGPGELQGKTIWEKYPDEDSRQSKKLYFQSLVEEQPIPEPFVSRNRRKDGTVIDVHVDWDYLRDADGMLKGFLAVVTDVTQKVQAEQALQDSERRYRLLAENTVESIWSMDPDLNFTYLSPYTEEMFGYSVEEWLTLDWKEVIAPEHYEPVLESFESLLADPDSQGISREVVLRHKDGTNVWVEFSASTVHGEDGQLLGIVGVTRDISERKQIESAMAKRMVALTKPVGDGTQLSLDEIISLEDLQRLQEQFALATGVASIITNPAGVPITRPSNFCRLCSKVIRGSEKGRANCYRSDAILGKPAEGPTVQRCASGGLWDAGAAISVGGHHIANWLIGQVRDETMTEEDIRSYAREIGVDEEEAASAFLEVPTMSQEQFRQVAQALHTLANHLSSIAYQNIQQGRYIADLQNAEERLRKSETRYRQTMEAIRDGLWDWDMKADKVYWDARCYSMLGYEDKAFPLDRSAWEKLIHPDDLPSASEAVQEGGRDRGGFSVEFRYRTADGDWLWVQGRGQVIEHEGEVPVRMVGTHTDISARKEMELALAERRERFRAMFENMGSGVAVYSPIDGGEDFLFVDCNPKAEEITKTRREDLVGGRLLDLFPAMRDGEFLAALRRVDRTGEPEHLPPFYYKDAMREGWRENRIYKVPGGNLVAIFDDVTDRMEAQKRLEEAKLVAERANLAKTEFLANMSHEIRTPLSGVMGMLQLLQETPDEEQRDELLHNALTSSKRLMTLLTDILDTSAVETGKLQLYETRFSLVECLEAVDNLFSTQAKLAGVRLETNAEDVPNVTLSGDIQRLRQVLFNLVANAVKFTEDGSVRVEAHLLSSREQGTRRLLFVVSDTGIGIPEEMYGTIFDSFSQGVQGYTRQYQGAGLGLNIVKRMISLMGGALCIDSIVGKGTTLYVSLPFREVSEKLAEAAEVSPAHKRPSVASALKVLIVEDEVVNRMALERMLTNRGYEVVVAGDGAQAIESLRSTPVDLVLMDIQMPVMNGMETTEAIRSGQAGEAVKDVPIIAVTAYAMPEDEDKFLLAGMNAYISKPVQMEELEAMLGQFVAAEDAV